jgi:hypothetical protein
MLILRSANPNGSKDNVQKPRGRILTTQLYFPGKRLNDQDSLFDRRLVMRVSSSDEGRFGRLISLCENFFGERHGHIFNVAAVGSRSF